MRPASLARLMRAACGDAVALAACANDEGDHDRLAALVLLDPEPHPLATLTAFAVTNDPPAALRARMRAVAPAALRALHDAQDDDLVAVLRFRLRTRDVAALIDDLAPPPVLGDARALAVLARLSARCAAAVWSKASADAAPDGDDSLPLSDRRVVLACAVAQRPAAAAHLIARIGADGWADAPDKARRALLAAVTVDAQSAAKCGAAWSGMRPDERVRLAIAAAQPPPRPSPLRGEGVGRGEAAADLIECIGAEGWKNAPEEARSALLDAVAADAWNAARSSAAWNGMRPDERVRLAIAAAQSPDDAVKLIERIGAEGWAGAPDDARRALLDAVANKPQRAAKSGAAWSGMRPDERVRLAIAAARSTDAAASLITIIGADGWASAPDDARHALLNALANEPWIAACCSVAWTGMRPDERLRLTLIAAQRPDIAVSLIERIGSEGWMIAPDDARHALLNAIASDPQHALKTLLRLGDQLDNEQRAALARAALGGESAVPLLALTLADGLPWSDWMAIFLPAADDAAAVRDAWHAALQSLPPESLRQALARMPQSVAAALAPRRRNGMRQAPGEYARKEPPMRRDSFAQLACAACGDERALVACANDESDRDRLAALALLDLEPHPLATLTAFAVTRNPPAALRARMRTVAPAALRALYDAQDDDLVEILRSRLRERDVAALMDDLAPPPVLGDACAIAGLARLTVRCAAAVWSKAGADAAPDSGDSLPLDERRIVLARAVAQPPPHPLPPQGGGARRGEDAAALIERIGAEGWKNAPEEARSALLDAVAADAWNAARSSAAWNGMRPDERLRLARAVAQPPPHPLPPQGGGARRGDAAAALIERIGAEGWKNAPEEARSALLDAVAADAWNAARSSAAWNGMRPDERARLAIAAAQRSYAAAYLIKRIGAGGWAGAPDDARSALLDAVAADAWNAARSSAAWNGMRPDERARLAIAAAQSPDDAVKLIERIGAEGWAGAPDDARSALLDAVVADAQRAVACGAAWSGMRPDERVRLAIAAAQSPDDAVKLIERIGAEGWAGAPEDARQSLINAVSSDPQHALKTLIRLGDRLDEAERATLARAALGGANASRAMAQALADGLPWRGWMANFIPAADDAAAVRDAWCAAPQTLDEDSLRQALEPRHRAAPAR